jgi:hypothetical protein
MKMSAATQLRSGTRRGTPPRGRGWWRWQQRLDALPQLLGQASIHQTGHDREHPSASPYRSSAHQAVPECLLRLKASPTSSGPPEATRIGQRPEWCFGHEK